MLGLDELLQLVWVSDDEDGVVYLKHGFWKSRREFHLSPRMLLETHENNAKLIVQIPPLSNCPIDQRRVDGHAQAMPVFGQTVVADEII